MGSGRYDNKVQRFNRSQIYSELRKKRGVKQIKQFLTSNVRNLTFKDRFELSTIRHTWTAGDRFYKLAYKYYNNVELWWVIAWYNQRPTENHVALGDILHIPFPVEVVVNLYNKVI